MTCLYIYTEQELPKAKAHFNECVTEGVSEMTSGALEIRRLYTVMYMYIHAQSRQSISQGPYTNDNKWYDIGVTPQKSYLVDHPSLILLCSLTHLF